MNVANVVFGSRRMTLEATRQRAKDRKECGAMVHTKMVEFHSVIFSWFLCSFGPPFRDLVAYQLDWGRMPPCRYMMQLG